MIYCSPVFVFLNCYACCSQRSQFLAARPAPAHVSEEHELTSPRITSSRHRGARAHDTDGQELTSPRNKR